MNKLMTTLLLIVKNDKILLAEKKRGFGVGLFNGVGGKVKHDETIEEAMLRETKEEINVIHSFYEEIAKIKFLEFVKGEKMEVEMHIFLAKNYSGEPIETEEMKPFWFDIKNIPYEKMFKDDSIWLPKILEEIKLEGEFEYDKDFELISHSIKII